MRSLILNLSNLFVLVLTSTALFAQSPETITVPEEQQATTVVEAAVDTPEKEVKDKRSEEEILLDNMFGAVTLGDADQVETMIKDGKVDYYRHNDTGETALTQAIQNEDISMVRLLVKEAIINLKNEDGETPLTLSMKKGNPDIIRLVMKRAKASLKNGAGEAPLLLALELNDLHLLQQLIKNGADVNRLSNGITPLSQAVVLNNYRAVGYLIRNGAIINQPNDNGDIPLYLAIENEYDIITGILIQKSEDAFSDVNWMNRIGDPLLNIAAASGNVEIIRMLIEAGASVNEIDHEENTPLHVTAANGHQKASIMMLQYEADINARNLKGATPVMLAAMNGQQNTYQMLLENGANSNIRDYQGMVAADYVNSTGNVQETNTEDNYASRNRE